MSKDRVLQSIDAASEGIEQLQQNVLHAIVDEKSGWFGARIKLSNGGVSVIQVTTDVEIAGATENRRRGKRA